MPGTQTPSKRFVGLTFPLGGTLASLGTWEQLGGGAIMVGHTRRLRILRVRLSVLPALRCHIPLGVAHLLQLADEESCTGQVGVEDEGPESWITKYQYHGFERVILSDHCHNFKAAAKCC